MPLFINEESHLFFIHIPKNGGASVEHFFRRYYEIALFSTSLHRKRHSFPCSPQHFEAEILNKLLSPILLSNSFAIVRDPVSRMVSEYKYRMSERVGNGRHVVTFNEFVVNSFEAYQSNPYILDNHIRPQTDFLLDETRIYKFEDGLNSCVKKETEILGIALQAPFSIPHVNNSKTKVRIDAHVEPRTRNLLCEFYRKDMEMFGYEC